MIYIEIILAYLHKKLMMIEMDLFKLSNYYKPINKILIIKEKKNRWKYSLK